jgi:hypothetical protein
MHNTDVLSQVTMAKNYLAWYLFRFHGAPLDQLIRRYVSMDVNVVDTIHGF